MTGRSSYGAKAGRYDNQKRPLRNARNPWPRCSGQEFACNSGRYTGNLSNDLGDDAYCVLETLCLCVLQKLLHVDPAELDLGLRTIQSDFAGPDAIVKSRKSGTGAAASTGLPAVPICV